MGGTLFYLSLWLIAPLRYPPFESLPDSFVDKAPASLSLQLLRIFAKRLVGELHLSIDNDGDHSLKEKNLCIPPVMETLHSDLTEGQTHGGFGRRCLVFFWIRYFTRP